jgi:hypothetical protein
MAIQKPSNSPENTKSGILNQIPALLEFVSAEAQSILLSQEQEL